MAHHHGGERPDIGLEGNEDANEAGKRDGVEEDVAQNHALLAMIIGGSGRHDDTLRIDHFAHDAARAVRGSHQCGA